MTTDVSSVLLDTNVHEVPAIVTANLGDFERFDDEVEVIDLSLVSDS